MEFWLRPFAVQGRGRINGRKEVWCALTGSVVTGTFLGLILWATGIIELDNVWVIIASFIVASVGSFNNLDMLVFAGTVAVIIVFSITGITTAAVVGAVILIFLVAYAASTFFNAFSTAVFSVFIAAAGIASGERTGVHQTSGQLLITIGIILLGAFGYRILKKKEEADYSQLLMATVIVALPLSSFNTFFIITAKEANSWGLCLTITIIIAVIARMNILFFTASLPQTYKTKDAFYAILHKETLHEVTIISSKYPIILFTLCWTLSFLARFNTLGSEVLQNKLHILAAYFFAAPILSSGLLFYPLILPVAGWLYRPARLQQHTSPDVTPLISFWQSFALPLPRLKQYLALVAEKNIELGYATLRTVQTQSFQGMAARRAAQLVLNGKEGLSFSAYLAINTDEATLNQLLLGPPLARSVAILAATDRKKIKGRDILLSIYEKPSQRNKKGFLKQFLQKESISREEGEIFHLDEQSIKKRLATARSSLAKGQECTGKEEYRQLLRSLGNLTDPKDFQQLSQSLSYGSIPDDSSWLQDGWQIIIRLEIHRMGILQAYQSLNSIEAKKTYLRKQQERLKGIDWSDLPWFWAGIAEEIVQIWNSIYEQEIKETKEWLLLEIISETDLVRPGNTKLTLRIDNKSGAIAQQIHLTVKEQENITWVSKKLNVPGLLQGHGSSELRLDLHINQPGRYVINGTLTALDLDERSYEWLVNFVLHADEKGKPYQLAEKQYYIVGPRLSSDFLFVGRKHLLHDIELLWQKPENKEALLLIGLRRMGKSSLLEKIHRDGINDQIIPLLIDLQGKASQHAFLQTVAEAMAAELHCTAPVLEQNNPGPAFEQFLRSLTPQLAGRYFLLMIDEANFFARRNYGELPHLLRSLMQAPDVPLLLLFCGTYELRQGARDYDSILYNTTRTKNVSYFNSAESAEVLTRPVHDFLEYDPQALQLAFQLTHGHPLLLQALGDQLIQSFNDTVLAGKERSDYVTYGDMEQAGQQLSRKENPAFGNYWEDADIAQQKVLVVMASSLDETSRKRGSLEYLLAQAAELHIPLERKEGFKALDHLTQEEQLTYADGGYSFMVALYRRWILWYYPPERFRESL
ncbi:hypothetical protein GMJAKD_06335 [Candidatus Electrothrix aarhusensis]